MPPRKRSAGAGRTSSRRSSGRVPIRDESTPPRSRKKPAARKPPPESARRRTPPPRDEVPHEHDGPPPASPFVPGMSAECLVCPICVTLYALRQSRPEVMEHLMAAGHEMFLAMRAIVETTGDRWEQVNTLQRITVR